MCADSSGSTSSSDAQPPGDSPRDQLLSDWKLFCFCCGRFDDSDMCFCGFWKGGSCMPFAITVLTLYCYSIFIISSFLRFPFPSLQFASLLESTATTFFFLITYLSAVFRDPGFLPFHWHPPGRTKYSWRELMSGTLVRSDQSVVVARGPRPPGCSFSRSYGRYVIRADHVCCWIANWVGKRNHKQFLLMMVWGSLASASLFAWRFAPRRTPDGAELGLDIAAAVVEAVFAVVLAASAWQFGCEAASGATRVDRFRGIKGRPAETAVDGLRDVCGDGSVCCWMCPAAAFPDAIDLEEGV
jgi:hypothetical protein